MAEGAKITAARAAARAAYANAAGLVIVMALGLAGHVASQGGADVEAGKPAGDVFIVALIAVLLVGPLSATWLNSRVQRPDAKQGPIRFWSALPNWLAAWCSSLLGLMLLITAIQSVTGGDQGTLAVAGFIYMLAVWPLVVAMALAALISCAGVARPTGSNTLILAMLAFIFGVASFFVFQPWPLVLSILALAAWWWAVGLELARLDAPANG